MDNEELQKRLKWYENKYGYYVEKRGLNNWQNLFRSPNLLEWTILFMLIMVLFISWAYQYDIKECREFIGNIDTIACSICNINQGTDSINNTPLINLYNPLDITNITTKELNITEVDG